ncbi:MAG: hypothetical protein WCP35_09125, partial [Verrucomicrobiota bacterium]
ASFQITQSAEPTVLNAPADTVDLGDAATRQEEVAGRMPAPRGPGILPGASFQITQSAEPTVLNAPAEASAPFCFAPFCSGR